MQDALMALQQSLIVDPCIRKNYCRPRIRLYLSLQPKFKKKMRQGNIHGFATTDATSHHTNGPPLPPWTIVPSPAGSPMLTRRVIPARHWLTIKRRLFYNISTDEDREEKKTHEC